MHSHFSRLERLAAPCGPKAPPSPSRAGPLPRDHVVVEVDGHFLRRVRLLAVEELRLRLGELVHHSLEAVAVLHPELLRDVLHASRSERLGGVLRGVVRLQSAKVERRVSLELPQHVYSAVHSF